MITGKQRSYLKKLSHGKKPLLQVGKEGVTETFIEQLNKDLEIHELIKIKVLDNSMLSAKEIAREVVEQVNGEFVQAIGNKFTVYRASEEEPQIVLPK